MLVRNLSVITILRALLSLDFCDSELSVPLARGMCQGFYENKK
jgi:hypothetical protein